jgi:aarF domain-containing kinase
MSGKRLLDAAAVYKASRGVAAKYFALRRHQLNVYSKTSTLARAVKNQSDRVTLTVRAASALTQRFNGPGPGYSTQAKPPSNPERDTSLPSEKSVKGVANVSRKPQGLEQDHFYENSQANITAEPVQDGQLGVTQERATSNPLPDGSILSVGAGAGQAKGDEDVYSSIPPTELAKEPLSKRSQEADSALKPTSSARSSILRPSAGTKPPPADEAKRLQRQAEMQIPSQAAEPPSTEASTPDIASSSAASAKDSSVDQRQDTFYSPSSKTGEVLSALPRVKLPRATAASQESDPRVPDEQINQDVFYSSDRASESEAAPEVQAVPGQEGPSEDMYSELFHSPKVAKILREQPREGKSTKGLDLPDTGDVRPEKTKPSQQQDQATFDLRTTQGEYAARQTESATVPEPQDTFSKDETQQFAEDLAKDAEKGPTNAEVSLR